MKNAEFMQLISSLRDLDHHQRERLSASLNQASDEAKALDLNEACFESNSVCLHCASTEMHYTALVVLAGCDVTVASIAARPSTP